MNGPRAFLAPVKQTIVSKYLISLAANVFQSDWLDQTSRLVGLDKDTLLRQNGRIRPACFVMVLPADQHHLVSLYDGSIMSIGADTAKQFLDGSDTYLNRYNVFITTVFNSYTRSHLNFKNDLLCLLLNQDVVKSWYWRSGIRGQQEFPELQKCLWARGYFYATSGNIIDDIFCSIETAFR